jgi:hypothetical protein
MNPRWSPDEDAVLVQTVYIEGFGYHVAAKRLARSRAACHTRYLKLVHKGRAKPRSIKPKLDRPAIAPRPQPGHWHHKARMMRIHGVKLKDIAAEFNVTIRAVSMR